MHFSPLSFGTSLYVGALHAIHVSEVLIFLQVLFFFSGCIIFINLKVQILPLVQMQSRDPIVKLFKNISFSTIGEHC